MDDSRLDLDLLAVEQHLVTLSRRVDPDPSHHAQLRQELLRRHQELRTDTTQRAVRKLWPRLTWAKRLTLVAPPALAACVALVAILSGLQISGHQSPQLAEAAQITQALARTVPTVTSWQVDVQQERGNSAGVVQCPVTLGRDQRLWVRGGRAYFFSRGTWYRVTATLQGGKSPCSIEIQWAFATLPAHLEQKRFSILPDRIIHGRDTEGIRYASTQSGATVTSTLWVERSSGLALQVQQVTERAGRITERDTADYTYMRSQ